MAESTYPEDARKLPSLGISSHGWPVVTPAAMSAPLCRAILPTMRWRVMCTFTPAMQAPVG